MISDSAPWKAELERLAKELGSLSRRTKWSEAAEYRVERALMLGFFVIRRLHESRKITDDAADLGVRVQRYPLRGVPPDLLNWHRLDEHFDLSRGQPERVPLRRFCNQAIHSFVLLTYGTPRPFQGIFVASDWERNRCVLRVTLTEIERAFRAVARDVVLR